MRHLSPRLMFVFIGLISVLSVYFLYWSALPFVQQVDLRLKDARFLLRGKEAPVARVAILAVDNKSIKELGRWPWSRELTARLINKLKLQQAKVVALDMVFSEHQAAAPDNALAESISDSGNVVLGHFFREEPQPIDPISLQQVAGGSVKQVRIAAGVTKVPLPEYASLDANISLIGSGGAGYGFFNQQSDSDGLYRKAPLLLMYDGGIYPSLGLVALKHYLGGEISVDVAEYGIDSLAIGSRKIPANEHGLISLNWYGDAASIATYSAADLLAGRLPAKELKDRLVFVGVTETGIADVRATPFDPVLPGVEIHATFAANALENRFLTRNNFTLGLELTALFVLPLLLVLALSYVPGTWIGLAVFLCITCSYFGGNAFLFAYNRLDLTIAYPLLALLISYLGSEAYRNIIVEQKGRYLRKAFASYVSPDLVAELVKHPERLVLGGEKRELTVLFSDIRGFTSLSEQLSPEELVRLLNLYLTPMTRIVMDERGTLDKYIGDAVMALFNAPLDLSDHADRACHSALRMMQSLEDLNRGFIAQGLPAIAIGIGIHTGEAVVGNMGADDRFDYTAIGDTVNLSSRLEGLTKQYGVATIISGETRKKLTKDYFLRELDLVRVKGKEQPVAIFELRVEPLPEPEMFNLSLERYRASDFVAAETFFKDMAARYNDPVSRLYVERCLAYRQAPPLENWDGVFIAKDK